MRACRVPISKSWLFIGITARAIFNGRSVNRACKSGMSQHDGVSVKARKKTVSAQKPTRQKNTAAIEPPDAPRHT
jgi:hypothetical protein